MKTLQRFAYCESTAAISVHIRELSSAGKKLGGGADKPSLCERPVAWDLRSDVDRDASYATCRVCREKWKKLIK